MKIALSGSGGRMGAAVQALIKSRPGMTVSALADRSHPVSGWKPLKIDGVIDFSLPPLFRETARWCEKHRKPFVSGTTGLAPADRDLLQRISRTVPLFYGENMSWGIWQTGRWISSLPSPPLGGGRSASDSEKKGAGKVFSEPSPEKPPFVPKASVASPPATATAPASAAAPIKAVLLKDIHHKGKKDSPSGTALRLESRFPPGLRALVKIQSLREGEAFGTHRIEIQAAGEKLIVEHQALSREVFAEGALTALSWLVKQPPGFYTPENLYAPA